MANTAFSRVLNRLAPGATGSELAKLFEGKADRTTVLHWKAGRAPPPQWAIDRLKELHAEIGADLAQTKTGPGRLSGLQPGKGLRVMQQRRLNAK